MILHGTITLVCEASGDPPPTVVWMKNGTPLFEGDEEHVISHNGRQLTIIGGYYINCAFLLKLLKRLKQQMNTQVSENL